MSIGGDDHPAAQLVPLAQQPCAGVEVLAVAPVYAAGIHFQNAVVLPGSLQRLERCGLVARGFLVKKPAVRVQLFDKVDMSQNVRLFGGDLLHLGKIGFHRCQRIAVKIVADAVPQILGAEIDLVVFAGIFAVQVVCAADPVIKALGRALAQQVPLDAAQDVHLAPVLVFQLGNGGAVLRSAAGGHAVFAVGLCVAVAAETKGGQPLRTGGTGHLLQGVLAVTQGRVAMYAGLSVICHRLLTASFPA